MPRRKIFGNFLALTASNLRNSALAYQDTDSPISEPELVRRSQQGDNAAFGEIVMRYQDRLYNTVYRMLGSAEDARDVVQDSFVRAFEGIGGFRLESSLSTWLYRIAVNSALSQRRRMARLRVVGTFDDGNPDSSPWLQNQPDLVAPVPSDHIEAGEVRVQVHQALDSLDEEHRTVVVLRDIQQCDYQQIAVILDVPVGTVKSRLHRARMLLRSKLRMVMKM